MREWIAIIWTDVDGRGFCIFEPFATFTYFLISNGSNGPNETVYFSVYTVHMFVCMCISRISMLHIDFRRPVAAPCANKVSLFPMSSLLYNLL